MHRLDVEDLLCRSCSSARANCCETAARLHLRPRPPGEEEIERRVAVGVFERGPRQPDGARRGRGRTVWETGEPLVVDDYDAWEGRAGDDPAGPDPGARRRAAVVRAVTSSARSASPASHADGAVLRRRRTIERLQRFAQIASIALDNARLYAAAQEARAAADAANAAKGVVPRHDEPRDPHADERDHRHERAAAARPGSSDEQREFTRDHPLQRRRPARRSSTTSSTSRRSRPGKMELEVAPFSLRECAEAVLDLMAPLAAARRGSTSPTGSSRASRTAVRGDVTPPAADPAEPASTTR